MVAHPFIYEINTWAWLDELSRRAGTTVDLASVPDAEWEAIASLGFDAVWLMGVWERSPAGIAIALENPALVESFRRALPDFTPDDVVGSPYCIRDYGSTTRLGGPEGLAAARAGARAARARADPRLRPQPRRARPSVAARAPGVLRPRRRGGPRARPGVVRPGRRPSSSRTAATRTSRPGPTSSSSNAFSPDLRAAR